MPFNVVTARLFNVVTARLYLILATSYNHDFQREPSNQNAFPVSLAVFLGLFSTLLLQCLLFLVLKLNLKKKIKAAFVRRKQETSKIALTGGIFFVC